MIILSPCNLTGLMVSSSNLALECSLVSSGQLSLLLWIPLLLLFTRVVIMGLSISRLGETMEAMTLPMVH